MTHIIESLDEELLELFDGMPGTISDILMHFSENDYDVSLASTFVHYYASKRFLPFSSSKFKSFGKRYNKEILDVSGEEMIEWRNLYRPHDKFFGGNFYSKCQWCQKNNFAYTITDDLDFDFEDETDALAFKLMWS